MSTIVQGISKTSKARAIRISQTCARLLDFHETVIHFTAAIIFEVQGGFENVSIRPPIPFSLILETRKY